VKLHALRVLTNENVHPAVVTFLRGRGLDVATATEAMLRGAEDVAVLRRATAENRLVLTHDADFGRLAIAAGEPFVGPSTCDRDTSGRNSRSSRSNVFSARSLT
jgi:predicted nuclease of predicted toxin-antitoxin system